LHLSDDNRTPSIIASASAIGHDGGRAADKKSAVSNSRTAGKPDQAMGGTNGQNGDNGNGGRVKGATSPAHELADSDSAKMPTVTARRPAE
jgi:hypothetical protein